MHLLIKYLNIFVVSIFTKNTLFPLYNFKNLSLIALIPSILIPSTSATEITENKIFNSQTFNNIYPGDWAYEVLDKSINNRGCNAVLSKSYVEIKGFKNIVSQCLSKIENKTNNEKLLLKAFNNDKNLKENNTKNFYGDFEAGSFAKTSLVDFESNFILGSNKYSGTSSDGSTSQTHPDYLNENYGKTTFHYEFTVKQTTYFSAQDFLRASVKTSNLSSSSPYKNTVESPQGYALDNNALAYGFSPTTTDSLELHSLYYSKSFGSSNRSSILFGPKITQDDSFSFYPSAYPQKTVLDFFGFSGSPMTYGVLKGSGVAYKYENDLFNFSAGYISHNNEIATNESDDVYALQTGFVGDQFGLALAYTYNKGQSRESRIPTATDELGDWTGNAFGKANRVNYSLSTYWKPLSQDKVFPSSISAGIGWSDIYHQDYLNNSYDPSLAISWSVGATWEDLFNRGNNAGIAFGQSPHFVRNNTSDEIKSGADDDLFMSEAWYEYAINDNISITPGVFYIHDLYGSENASAANPDNVMNNFGLVLNTSFKF